MIPGEVRRMDYRNSVHLELISLIASFLAAMTLWQPGNVASANDAPADSETHAVYFNEYVLPIFQKHCYECHSHQAKNVKGGLVLDSRNGWTVGGESGPAVVPGNPDKSLLISAIGYANSDLQMPPTGRLAKRDIDRLMQWVKMGAPDPRDEALSTRPKKKKKTHMKL